MQEVSLDCLLQCNSDLQALSTSILLKHTSTCSQLNLIQDMQILLCKFIIISIFIITIHCCLDPGHLRPREYQNNMSGGSTDMRYLHPQMVVSLVCPILEFLVVGGHPFGP